MASIMLVDDDRDLTHLTKIALAQKGYEVLVFNDAGKAIEEARQRKPDMIFMDIMLPGISGGEAVRKLQKDPALKAIPVVFLTGLISHGEKDLEKEGISIDGHNYPTLGKPYEIDDLLKVVAAALRK